MPSLEEESFWEPNIKEFETTDLVQGSPVAIAGQDYAFSGNNIQLATYLKTVVVKDAGGAGATLVAGVDYTVHLRTGIVTRLGGGALVGDTHAWVSYTKSGNDDVAHRQLANRLQKLKDDLATLGLEVAVIDSFLLGLGAVVPQARVLTAGLGLSGLGDLSANRTVDLDIATSGERGGVPGFGAAPNGYLLGLAGGALAWISAAMKVDVQNFTANGNWAKPAGTVLAVCIQLVGAGGSGGGGHWRTSGTGGGGGSGSAGNRAYHWFFADEVLNNAAITIGAAGAIGTGSTVASSGGGDGTDGADGGDTTVTWTNYALLARGGRGGRRGVVTVSGDGGTSKLVTNNATTTAETEDMRVAVGSALQALGAAAMGSGSNATPRAGERTSLAGGAAGANGTNAVGGNGGPGGHVPGVSAGNGTTSAGTGGTAPTGGAGGTGYGAGGGGGAGAGTGGARTYSACGNGGLGAGGHVRFWTLYVP